MDEFFGFHNILVMGMLQNKVHMMVHITPRLIRGGHSFHDVFIRMEYGWMGGRNTT